MEDLVPNLNRVQCPNEELAKKIDSTFSILQKRRTDPEWVKWHRALLLHDIGAVATPLNSIIDEVMGGDGALDTTFVTTMGQTPRKVEEIIKFVAAAGKIKPEDGADFGMQERIPVLQKLLPILGASVRFFYELTPESYNLLREQSISFQDLLAAMNIPYKSDDVDMAQIPALNGAQAVIWLNLIKNADEAQRHEIKEPGVQFAKNGYWPVLSNLSMNENIVSFQGQEFPDNRWAIKGFGSGIVSKLAALEGLQVQSSVAPILQGQYRHSFFISSARPGEAVI